MEIKRLLEASLGERLTEGETVLMGEAMLSKSLIQISVDGRGCVPSLLFDLRPNYGGGNEDNGNLLQKIPYMYNIHVWDTYYTYYNQCPQPCSRLTLTHPSTGDSWTLTGKSGSVSFGGHCSFLLGPGAQGSVCALQVSITQYCVSSGRSMVGLMVTSS